MIKTNRVYTMTCPYCGNQMQADYNAITSFPMPGIPPIKMPLVLEYLSRKQVFHCYKCRAVIEYDSITQKITAKRSNHKNNKA